MLVRGRGADRGRRLHQAPADLWGALRAARAPGDIGFSFQTAAFVLAAHFARELLRCLSRGRKGRRGTPGTSGPHGPVCGMKARESSHRRCGKFPGVPRAVFLGLLRPNPSGLTKSPFLFGRPLLYPPLAWSARRARAAWPPGETCVNMILVTAQLVDPRRYNL
jgi:hypothetical protein